MEAAHGANPLLLGWLKEWLDQERERNTRAVPTYRNAYDSLRACPVTFQHPSQLQQLRGFGQVICDRLTKRLREHCEANGLPMPRKARLAPQSRDGLRTLQDEIDEEAEARQLAAAAARKPRKTKPYVPALRSGPYAIVLALATLGEDATVGMTKPSLIELAQPHCDASFTVPADPTKFYTAWNSMKTLLDKGLVYERGRPLRRYTLTDEGWEVARRIQQTNELQGNELQGNGVADPPRRKAPAAPAPAAAAAVAAASTSAPSACIDLDPRDEPQLLPRLHRSPVETGPSGAFSASALPAFTPIRLPPGSFTVELLLDVREIRARTDRDYMQEELAKQGVKPMVRALELGDIQWVAKCRDPRALSPTGAEGDEVVLDWIVERKRLDDLVSSIKDGRFHEQKFRLRRSGVRNVVYVVEEIAMDAQVYQKHEEAVRSAMASTQVVDGYFLKRTQKMDDTIRYLARMTAMLKRRYEGTELRVIPTSVLTAENYLPLLRSLRESEPNGAGHYVTYQTFSQLASKSDAMTLRDVFLKMLMTTRGVTGEKAIEIQRCWNTPNELVKAFAACGPGEAGKKRKREMVAGRLAHLGGRKKIARPVSDRVAEVWGDA